MLYIFSYKIRINIALINKLITMIINRENIFKKFKWLKNKNNKFIISSDYDGLICASFLSHYLDWELAGYYNMEKIWLSQKALKHKKDLIWVDLNIVPKQGKAIGGHIAIYEKQLPSGLKTSCNLNILNELSQNHFDKKFPFSTLLFLSWLFKKPIPKNKIGNFLILHSDCTWMKIQKYSSNVTSWKNLLVDYDWDSLINQSNSISFEKNIDQHFYPLLSMYGAHTAFSKLTSKHLGIKSRECIINPDWDEDIILNLFDLFAEHLLWDPPTLPAISTIVKGEKFSIPLSKIKKVGLNKLIQNKKIFSYAITSPKTLKYTVFNTIK